MGELSFLIELLLNHKLAKPTKDIIAARIKDIEQGIPQQQSKPHVSPVAQPAVASFIPAEQNSAVQQALAQRQAAMTGGGKSLFRPSPNPAPK